LKIDSIIIKMVLKVIEIIGTSPESFEAALAEAVAKAGKTVRGISGVDVVGQIAKVIDGKITEYRVTAKVAFGVE